MLGNALSKFVLASFFSKICHITMLNFWVVDSVPFCLLGKKLEAFGSLDVVYSRQLGIDSRTCTWQ